MKVLVKDNLLVILQKFDLCFFLVKILHFCFFTLLNLFLLAAFMFFSFCNPNSTSAHQKSTLLPTFEFFIIFYSVNGGIHLSISILIPVCLENARPTLTMTTFHARKTKEIIWLTKWKWK